LRENQHLITEHRHEMLVNVYIRLLFHLKSFYNKIGKRARKEAQLAETPVHEMDKALYLNKSLDELSGIIDGELFAIHSLLSKLTEEESDKKLLAELNQQYAVVYDYFNNGLNKIRHLFKTR